MQLLIALVQISSITLLVVGLLTQIITLFGMLIDSMASLVSEWRNVSLNGIVQSSRVGGPLPHPFEEFTRTLMRCGSMSLSTSRKATMLKFDAQSTTSFAVMVRIVKKNA